MHNLNLVKHKVLWVTLITMTYARTMQSLNSKSSRILICVEHTCKSIPINNLSPLLPDFNYNVTDRKKNSCLTITHLNTCFNYTFRKV
jgi:hypothetical protein